MQNSSSVMVNKFSGLSKTYIYYYCLLLCNYSDALLLYVCNKCIYTLVKMTCISFFINKLKNRNLKKNITSFRKFLRTDR